MNQSRPYVKISFKVNKAKYYPLYAIWLKDDNDKKVNTFFVIKKAVSLKKSRPSALPVWYGVESTKQKNVDDIDAVSGATLSDKEITIYFNIPEDMLNKKVNLYLEANASFDYNDQYVKDKGDDGYSGVNGQPSIIWEATFNTNKIMQSKVSPIIIGHGEVLGKNDRVYSDISKITSAKDLISNIELTYIPGKN